MAKSKPKKISHPVLLAVGGFLFLATLSALITFKQLHTSQAQAASCDYTVNPGQSINSVANSASINSTVCVNPGTYTGNINIDRSRTGITLLSTQKWGAKIVGIKGDTDRIAALEINADNVTLDGFDVSGPTIKLGIAAEGANIQVLNSYVHDIAMTLNPAGCDDWGAAGIEFGNYRPTSNNGLAMNNLVENVATGQKCVYYQGIYFSQPSGKIINNIVKNVDAFCIHLWHSASTGYQIYNNVVTGCGKATATSGITIGADTTESATHGVTSSVIANNIIMNSGRGIEENNASGNEYRNNINYNVSADQIDINCSANICSNNTITNPQLDSSYRPMAGSPVINAGYSSGAPTTDYEGNSRTGIPDIGAIEYAGSQPVPTNTPTQQQPTATPRPNTTPTSTPRPQPTTVPQPTTSPTGNTTINFNSANVGSLTGDYPAGVITWVGSSWSISNPWEQLSSRNLGFRNSKTSQGSFNFKTPSIIKSIDAYNGTIKSSIVTITCGSNPKITFTLTSKKITTITTGHTSTCTTVTITSSNGWDTNFDNLTYK